MRFASLIGALGLGAASAAGVAACGATNSASPRLPTVTITSPAPAPVQQPTTASMPTTTPIPNVTTPANQTRTGTAPAFTNTTGGTSAQGGSLGAAVASLKARGYTPVGTASYDPNQTLRVLIGSSGGREQAFFFDGTAYLGTDTKLPSRAIAVTGQSDTEVTLRYATTSGPATVHFELDMGRLTPLDPIPSAAGRTG